MPRGFPFRPARFAPDWTVQTDARYQLVRLNNGICSVRSLVDAETFHPVVGPVAEAEALYVKQLQLRERLQNHAGEFVIWDVGLGAAANALAVLRATRDIVCQIRIFSFDHTLEPLEFALKHASELGYFGGYEKHLEKFIRAHRVEFSEGPQSVNWEFHHGDFPTFLSNLKLKTQNSPQRRTPSCSMPIRRPGIRRCGRCRSSRIYFASSIRRGRAPCRRIRAARFCGPRFCSQDFLSASAMRPVRRKKPRLPRTI